MRSLAACLLLVNLVVVVLSGTDPLTTWAKSASDCVWQCTENVGCNKQDVSCAGGLGENGCTECYTPGCIPPACQTKYRNYNPANRSIYTLDQTGNQDKVLSGKVTCWEERSCNNQIWFGPKYCCSGGQGIGSCGITGPNCGENSYCRDCTAQDDAVPYEIDFYYCQQCTISQ